ncbi:hypothetical protein LH431_11160 [Laribacter hongkongensis]|uniref:hypothetical protein n=1 Tax=Laribacter hongkongensis TaxID=168471 RepID=UPI001EFE5564|nr:hypothetical protein [Laribacter hongkongensis]MCG9011155.1 hypothetical protein [Laribacter hongkongensis]MCG9047215.1 hypothetical protein [Laribacter hongkongensis]
MYVLAKTCLVLILASLVSGCGESENPKTEQSNTPAVEQSPQSSNQATEQSTSIAAYTITADERKRNTKRSVEVLLDERISKDALTIVANKIKADEPETFERTFIAYRIKGVSDSSYWATSHFDPDLDVKIHGITADGYASILESDETVPGKKIGVWLSDNGPDEKIIAYTSNGKNYIKFIRAPGLGSDEYQYSSKKEGGKTKFIEVDGNGREFFAINESGDLEFWGERGNYYTAPKFEKPKAAD